MFSFVKNQGCSPKHEMMCSLVSAKRSLKFLIFSTYIYLKIIYSDVDYESFCLESVFSIKQAENKPKTNRLIIHL